MNTFSIKDPEHRHWNTQCKLCGEWFTKNGLARHKHKHTNTEQLSACCKAKVRTDYDREPNELYADKYSTCEIDMITNHTCASCQKSCTIATPEQPFEGGFMIDDRPQSMTKENALKLKNTLEKEGLDVVLYSEVKNKATPDTIDLELQDSIVKALCKGNILPVNSTYGMMADSVIIDGKLIKAIAQLIRTEKLKLLDVVETFIDYNAPENEAVNVY